MSGLFHLLSKIPILGPWCKAKALARRRARYEFLKNEISKRHFGGYAGLVIDFKGRKFDKYDFACFKQPMYFWVKNKDNKWCVFWHRERMAREIGTGGEIKDGEMLVPDSPGRTKPSSTLETINETAPLTVKAPDEAKDS